MNRTLPIVETRKWRQLSDRLVPDAGMNAYAEAAVTVEGHPVFWLHIISGFSESGDKGFEWITEA